MARNDMLKGDATFYEDFLSAPDGSNNNNYGNVTVTVGGSETIDQLAINGGAARAGISTGEDDIVAMFGPAAYEPDEAGHIAMQCRIRSSVVASSSVFVGFTDSDADSVVIEDEDGTLNTVATDAFGILLEGEQDATWQTVGVQNNTDNSQAASTNITDLSNSEWTTIYIEADAASSGRYRVYIDGTVLKTANTDSNGWTTSALRSSIVYTPCFFSADGRATAYNLDIAEAWATGGVGSSFD